MLFPYALFFSFFLWSWKFARKEWKESWNAGIIVLTKHKYQFLSLKHIFDIFSLVLINRVSNKKNPKKITLKKIYEKKNWIFCYLIFRLRNQNAENMILQLKNSCTFPTRTNISSLDNKKKIISWTWPYLNFQFTSFFLNLQYWISSTTLTTSLIPHFVFRLENFYFENAPINNPLLFLLFSHWNYKGISSRHRRQSHSNCKESNPG